MAKIFVIVNCWWKIWHVPGLEVRHMGPRIHIPHIYKDWTTIENRTYVASLVMLLVFFTVKC